MPLIEVPGGHARPSVIVPRDDRLDHHLIVSGSEVVGVWEYDPKTETVVTRVWRTDRCLKERVAEAAVDTGRFIR